MGAISVPAHTHGIHLTMDSRAGVGRAKPHSRCCMATALSMLPVGASSSAGCFVQAEAISFALSFHVSTVALHAAQHLLKKVQNQGRLALSLWQLAFGNSTPGCSELLMEESPRLHMDALLSLANLGWVGREQKLPQCAKLCKETGPYRALSVTLFRISRTDFARQMQIGACQTSSLHHCNKTF